MRGCVLCANVPSADPWQPQRDAEREPATGIPGKLGIIRCSGERQVTTELLQGSAQFEVQILPAAHVTLEPRGGVEVLAFHELEPSEDDV